MNLCVPTLKLHVFIGGKKAVNEESFQSAYADAESDLRERVHLEKECMTVEYLRKNKWTLEQLTSWLKEGDIYVILHHPAQGVTSFQCHGYWEPWDLTHLSEILHHELKDRIGWPEDVRCPVLLQTKIQLKRALKNITVPFLVINRTETGMLNAEVKRQIFK